LRWRKNRKAGLFIKARQQITVSGHLEIGILAHFWEYRCWPLALLSHQLPGGFVLPLTVRPDRGAPAEKFD
jgi:hypothetical protein